MVKKNICIFSNDEYYDIKICKWLMKNINKINFRIIEDINYDPISRMIKLLSRILKSKDGILTVNYSSINGERYFLRNKQISYQNMMREFRYILCRDIYYDIDIINCHPVLLQQYCKKNKIECKYLKKYVENRDKYIKDSGVEKEIYKKIVLKIMNGCLKLKEDEKNDKFLNNLFEEIKQIHTIISKLNPDIMDYVEKGYYDDDENTDEKEIKKFSTKEGRVCNHLLQKLENKVLMSTVNFFRKNGYSIGGLIFDGLVVRKTKIITDDTLKSLEKYVKSETEFSVSVAIKSMEHNYVIEDEEDEIEKLYNERKKIVESIYFFVKKPFGFGYISDNNELNIINEKQFKFILGEYDYDIIEMNGKKISVNFFEKWTKDPTKRKYDRIVFEPSNNHKENELNLFTGFKYENKNYMNEKNTEFIHTFLKNLLITDEIYNYFLDWIAYIIQYKTKTDVALIFYSHKHGVGKDTILIMIRKILGEKYCVHLKNFNDIDKDFNSYLENKLFITASEIKAKTQDLYDTFKDIITRKTIKINKKNIEAYEINDYGNYAFTTNYYMPIKMEKNDRRTTIIECCEEKLSLEVSSKLYEIFDNDDIMGNFYNELKNRKIPEKGHFRCLDTEHKKNLQKNHEISCIKYVYNNLNYLKNKTITTTELFTKIKEYEKNNNFHEITDIKHLHKILELELKIVSFKSYKKEFRKLNVYEFDDEVLEKLKLYNIDLYYENINKT
jgi:hypothetical protein